MRSKALDWAVLVMAAIGVPLFLGSFIATARWEGETKAVVESETTISPIAMERVQAREAAAQKTADSLRAVATAQRIEIRSQRSNIVTLRARYDSAASERDSLQAAQVLIPQQATAIETLEGLTLTQQVKLASDSIARADAEAVLAERIERLTDFNERLTAQLKSAPALQLPKRRRLLGVLPHPGDAVVFVAGAVAGGYIVSRVR